MKKETRYEKYTRLDSLWMLTTWGFWRDLLKFAEETQRKYNGGKLL